MNCKENRDYEIRSLKNIMFELVKGAIWTGIRKTPAAEHPLSQLVLNDDEIYLFSKYLECYRKQLSISTIHKCCAKE